MIILPKDTQEAVWLSRQIKGSPGGSWEKHYILAYHEHLLFRTYNKQDGSFVGNIVESYIPPRDASRKLHEKEKKGYKHMATWDPSRGLWTTALSTVLPPVVGGRSSLYNECRLAKVVLKTQQEESTLKLFKTSTGHFRLDHSQSWQPPEHDGTPLWQTLFSDEGKARVVLQEVIRKKEEMGYMIIEQSPVAVQPPTTLADLYPLSSKVAEAFKGVQADVWF